MQVAEKSNQIHRTPIWVQSPYSRFQYNIEPLLYLCNQHGALEIPSETAKEIDEAIIGLTCSSYCPEPLLTSIYHLTLIRLLLASIEIK